MVHHHHRHHHLHQWWHNVWRWRHQYITVCVRAVPPPPAFVEVHKWTNIINSRQLLLTASSSSSSLSDWRHFTDQIESITVTHTNTDIHGNCLIKSVFPLSSIYSLPIMKRSQSISRSPNQEEESTKQTKIIVSQRAAALHDRGRGPSIAHPFKSELNAVMRLHRLHWRTHWHARSDQWIDNEWSSLPFSGTHIYCL